jgi:pimeloyl-ACP methyl ester carboxylesterase
VFLASGCAAPAAGESTATAGRVQQTASRSGYAPINGLRMYYEVHGSGRPLVLLHGGGSSIRTTFGEVLPMLAQHHQLIAVEQQGHGHTADIDRPLSFEQMADDTDALLAHLGIDQADVFGFSNGGSVGMQLAIRHPARVRRLVVGSSFYANDGLAPQVRELFRRPGRVADMPPPLREEYLRIAPHPDHLQRLVDKQMAMLSSFRDWSPEALRSISAPTMVLQGNMDVAKPEHVLEMCRLIPRCELSMLPGGHGSYIGEATAPRAGSGLPGITVALIEGFLGQS